MIEQFQGKVQQLDLEIFKELLTQNTFFIIYSHLFFQTCITHTKGDI